jgi:hypothetical protein
MALDGADFVAGLYREILGRDPDEPGLRHYLCQLLIEKTPKLDLVRAFAASEEARLRGCALWEEIDAWRQWCDEAPVQDLSVFFGLDDSDFVRNAFYRILERGPQPEEADAYARLIADEPLWGRLETLRRLSRHPESSSAGRVLSGLEEWACRPPIRSRPTPPVEAERKRYLLRELLDEFDGSDFVRHVFRCLLKREPDPEGHVLYRRLLESGELSKAEILAAIATGPEARAVGVETIGLRRLRLRLRLFSIPLLGTLFRFAAACLGLPKLERELWRVRGRLAAAERLLALEAKELARRGKGLSLRLHALTADLEELKSGRRFESER